jgi:hypothetical protein
MKRSSTLIAVCGSILFETTRNSLQEAPIRGVEALFLLEDVNDPLKALRTRIN